MVGTPHQSSGRFTSIWWNVAAESYSLTPQNNMPWLNGHSPIVLFFLIHLLKSACQVVQGVSPWFCSSTPYLAFSSGSILSQHCTTQRALDVGDTVYTAPLWQCFLPCWQSAFKFTWRFGLCTGIPITVRTPPNALMYFSHVGIKLHWAVVVNVPYNLSELVKYTEVNECCLLTLVGPK